MATAKSGTDPTLGRALAVDQIVAGKYRITRLIGRGGMGSVWEGVHTSLGTRVAIKFIDAGYVGSADARNRFANEARATAKLDSKHVVKVFDHGLTDDGHPWIVMEYLQGEPLDRRLARVARLTPGDTARVVKEICRALSKAHAAGIVHRDLKPENIFLVWDDDDRADVVKVVDFGVAKFTDGSPGVSSSTRTGAVLGTPYYMSPEQARGLRSVDHRTDLWSVGVIAYQCLIGSLPFEGEALGDLLVKICAAPLPVPSEVAPDVPPGFDAWFAKALSRETEERFASAQELAEALSVVCGVSAPVPSDNAGTRVGPVQAITASTVGSPVVSNVGVAPSGRGLRVLGLGLGLAATTLVVGSLLWKALGASPDASPLGEPETHPAAEPGALSVGGEPRGPSTNLARPESAPAVGPEGAAALPEASRPAGAESVEQAGSAPSAMPSGTPSAEKPAGAAGHGTTGGVAPPSRPTPRAGPATPTNKKPPKGTDLGY